MIDDLKITNVTTLVSAKGYLDKVLTEEQMNIVTKLGYFSQPASTKYHLAKEGGLAEHSLNVTTKMLELNKSMNLGIEEKEIILTGMLHDFCKVGNYEPNILKSGKVSEAIPYTYNSKIDLGHGSTSVYLIINELGIKLPVHIATAITHHMGFNYSDKFSEYALRTICKYPKDITLAWLLITADTYATWIMENEGELE